MATNSLVDHLLHSGDIKSTKENILSFLSSKLNKQCVDCDFLKSLRVIVLHLVEFSTNTGTGLSDKRWIVNIFNTILTETCIPTLCMPRPTVYDVDKKDKMKILEITYEVVSNIVCKGPLENAQSIWSLVLKSLQNFVDECEIGLGVSHEVKGSQLPVATALDLLAYLLDNISGYEDGRLKFTRKENSAMEMEENVFHAVLDVLSAGDNESLLFKITGRILPRLLSIMKEKYYQNTEIIWKSVKISLQEQNGKTCVSGSPSAYGIMSSLADLYFKESNKTVFKIHHDPAFWSMIQAGLVNIDSLVRKRSLYLLQKVVEMYKEQGQMDKVYLEETSPVFWWNPDSTEEILEIWQQYVFFLETLEEQQLHVIQPVLLRIEELINATKKVEDVNFPVLHVSWLSVIVHRAAIHENRFIKKWGIMVLLTLNLDEIPLLDNTVTREFTSGTFVMLLKEPTLYAKNHGESKAEASALAKQLLEFFSKCFRALSDEEKIGFFTKVFTSISRHNISHVPLTFISQSLSKVPRSAIFGSELLSILRNIILTMRSHSVVLRGAVKTFLLRIFMSFIKPMSVSVSEVLLFLGSFVKEESLCRGTQLWNEVAAWLSESYLLFQRETKDLFAYLDSHVRLFLNDEYNNKTRESSLQLSKFLLLCYDCSAITKNEINQLFDLIFVTISKAYSNAYQPVSSCWRAVELLYGLSHELLGERKEHTIANDLTITLMSRLHDVLHSLTQTLVRSIGQEEEYPGFHGYNSYFAMLDKVKSLWLIYKFPGKLHVAFQTLLNRLADFGLSIWSTETPCMTVKQRLLFLVTLRLNIWLTEFTNATDFVLTKERRDTFLKCIWSLTLTSNLHFPNKAKCHEGIHLNETTWRIIAEDTITTKWRCVNIAIRESDGKVISDSFSSNTLARSSYSAIVEECVEALSLTSGPACYPCLETLRLCLPELIQAGDESTTILLLKTVWNMVNELRTRYSGYFWPAFGNAVRIIFAPELLSLRADSLLVSCVTKYWESLLKISDDQTGLIGVAVAHLCDVFSNMYRSESVNAMPLDYHTNIIADICLFGPVHKKDQKLLLDTRAYVKCSGDESGITKCQEYECESLRARIDLLAFLMNLNYNSQACSLFIIKLIRVLLERNTVLSKSKASRFLNSENHRKKQRLWQIILVLVPRITNDKFALEFSGSVRKALEGDNQTSVRFLMEWSLVRLFSSRIHLLETVWEEMKNLYKTRLGYVASLISIVTHVFLTIDKPDSQMEYLRRLIPAILPCAFLNHSQIRAYILATLQLISDTSTKDVWSQLCQQFPLVQSCLLFTQSVVEGVKEKNRLQKDRDLFSLHPIEDFSIEVIFKTVPLITGVVDDEVITPGAFENEGSGAWVGASDFPLYRRNLKQENHESAGENETAQSDLCPTEKADTVASSVSLDVQKKITPWNVTGPLLEDQDSFEQLRQRPLERRVGDLVVVASLIDRAPNLGGLCRTCEIFGASRLVLGSKNVVAEKDFKSVSVSSEKWVDIEEVMLKDLEMYLSSMKREGFTIVGVEQTAQSKKLVDFQFPRSTVLVLGNEKSGIPVEVIQLLDECVEIRQHGIIRSLNVHVSGALLIWEYSRQHLSDDIA